jgi:hypothetical protein
MCVQRERMPIVEKRRADKETLNAGHSVARYQERTVSVCDDEFQPAKWMR